MSLSPHPPVNELILSAIIDQSRDATAIYAGEDLIIRAANDPMIRLWGKASEVIGLPVTVVLPTVNRKEIISLLKNLLQTGTTYRSFEQPVILNVKGHPKTYYFDATYRAITDHDGKVICIIHTAIDVTQKVENSLSLKEQQNEQALLHQQLANSTDDLKEASKELTDLQEEMSGLYNRLQDSEILFQNIFDQAPLGLCWLRGPDMIVEQVNQPILKIWGRTIAEVIGQPIRQARPELEGQTILDRLQKVYVTGSIEVNSEYKVLLKDGEHLREAYVNSVYSPLRDQQGHMQGILVIIDEVTERVAERQRREVIEEQFRLSVESAELGTWFVNLNTHELISSPRLKELFGFYPEEQITLTDAVNQIREDYRSSVSEAIHTAIENETSYDMEFPVTGFHDQKLRWVRATGKLFPAKQGQAPHFSGVLADITSRKTEEKRKYDFIAIASHELKTPLTSAKAYVQLLLRNRAKLDTNTVDMLEKAERQIEKMHGIIKGFLDVARLDSGEIRLNMSTFLINELLEECVTEATLFTRQHELTIEMTDSISVTADRDKIGQVIINFLSNAIKYSPAEGKVIISCRPEQGSVGVYVTDYGIGVHPADQNRLFTRFYRVENQDTQTISGFGIGLYLCAEIVRLHQGVIGLSSTLGKGSTFYFTLPQRL